MSKRGVLRWHNEPISQYFIRWSPTEAAASRLTQKAFSCGQKVDQKYRFDIWSSFRQKRAFLMRVKRRAVHLGGALEWVAGKKGWMGLGSWVVLLRIKATISYWFYLWATNATWCQGGKIKGMESLRSEGLGTNPGCTINDSTVAALPGSFWRKNRHLLVQKHNFYPLFGSFLALSIETQYWLPFWRTLRFAHWHPPLTLSIIADRILE